MSFFGSVTIKTSRHVSTLGCVTWATRIGVPGKWPFVFVSRINGFLFSLKAGFCNKTCDLLMHRGLTWHRTWLLKVSRLQSVFRWKSFSSSLPWPWPSVLACLLTVRMEPHRGLILSSSLQLHERSERKGRRAISPHPFPFSPEVFVADGGWVDSVLEAGVSTHTSPAKHQHREWCVCFDLTFLHPRCPWRKTNWYQCTLTRLSNLGSAWAHASKEWGGLRGVIMRARHHKSRRHNWIRGLRLSSGMPRCLCFSSLLILPV